MLRRHVRHEGLRQIEQKLSDLSTSAKPPSELPTPTIGRLHARKLRELDKRDLPDAGIPKVVSFPAS